MVVILCLEGKGCVTDKVVQSRKSGVNERSVSDCTEVYTVCVAQSVRSIRWHSE